MERALRHDLTRAALLVLGAVLLWRLKFIIIIIFVSFTLTVVLEPFVRRLHKIHLPAIFAVVIPLLVLIGIVGTLAFYVGPAIAEQIPRFIRDFPGIIESQPFAGLIEFDLQSASNYLLEKFGTMNQIVVDLGTLLVKLTLGVLTVLVITVYWLGSYDDIKKTLLTYLPSGKQDRGRDIWERIEHKLGKWMLGQIMVSVSVGVLVWAAMRLLGLPYAGVLGVISALLEIIPTVGPVLAALPAIMIGATDSLETALIVTAIYIVIQQFESHVLTPQVMGRTVKLHPIVIITAFLSGSILFGVVGALFAVPAALVASAFVDSFRSETA